MSREQRPGDWAAWMDGGRASAPAPAPATPDPVEPAASPAPASRVSGGGTPAPRPPGDAPGPGSADAHRSARREATRQRVLDAARDVFAEQGVMGATVEAICERAGFTRGAFYSNFADRDDVIDALVEREQERLLAHCDVALADLERAMAGSADLPDVLGAIIDRVLAAVPIDRDLALIQGELENFAIRRPELAGRFVASNRRFRDRIAAFIADAMERNRRELLVDPGILTDAIIGISQRSVRRALLAGPEADPDEVASAILPGLLLTFSRPVDPSPSS